MPNDRLTVGAFLDRWLNVNIPGTIAESTEDDYNDAVRLHLRPVLGSSGRTGAGRVRVRAGFRRGAPAAGQA